MNYIYLIIVAILIVAGYFMMTKTKVAETFKTWYSPKERGGDINLWSKMGGALSGHPPPTSRHAEGLVDPPAPGYPSKYVRRTIAGKANGVYDPPYEGLMSAAPGYKSPNVKRTVAGIRLPQERISDAPKVNLKTYLTQVKNVVADTAKDTAITSINKSAVWAKKIIDKV